MVTKIQKLILENQKIMMNVLRPIAEEYHKDGWANILYKQVTKTQEVLEA